MQQQAETPSAPAPAKPKRKYRTRAKADEPKESPYVGLTDRSCCAACKEGNCVITRGLFCGRPGLALQPVDMAKPDVVARRKEAEKYLALKVTAARHNAQ